MFRVSEKLSIEDFKEYISNEKANSQNEIDKAVKIAKNSEKVASRLAEDVFEAIDMNNRKFVDLEDRMNELKEWVEKLSN